MEVRSHVVEYTRKWVQSEKRLGVGEYRQRSIHMKVSTDRTRESPAHRKKNKSPINLQNQ